MRTRRHFSNPLESFSLKQSFLHDSHLQNDQSQILLFSFSLYCIYSRVQLQGESDPKLRNVNTVFLSYMDNHNYN